MSCFSTGRKKRRPSRTARQNKASPGPAWVPELFVQDRRCLVGGDVLDAPWAAAIFWVLRRPQTPCWEGHAPPSENATGCRRFPRRFAPRNDKLGGIARSPGMPPYLQLPMALTERRYTPYFGVCHFNGGRYGTAVPSRDCTPRALPRASRSGRHVGLRPPRNDNSGAGAVLAAAGTGRRCLPEIAPQGHFLALRAQGATSACGLLAMTIREPVPF